MTKTKTIEAQADLLNAPQATGRAVVAANKKPPQKAPPSNDGPANLLSVIAAAAANPAVDAQKMKELLEMHRQIEARNQEREFNVAMLEAQQAMPRIVKDKDNSHTKSSYASLENVSSQIDSVARANGFAMSFGTADSPLPKHYRVVCDVAHDGGHTRRYFVDLEADTAGSQGKSNKTPIQGVGSTISYGRRYLKVMIFDLTIVGEDKDGNRAKPAARAAAPQRYEEGFIDAAQRTQLLKAIDDCGIASARFLEKFGIDAVHELPAVAFNAAIDACKTYGQRRAAKRVPSDG